MRKQFITSTKKILNSDINTVLLLGDISVFAFNEEFKKIPTRIYNVGILEQTMVGCAAGLAKSGLIPFVHTIAPFMIERAYEQLKIDFGYQKLKGNFISVGSSYDYSSLGATHHCPSDILILSGIPGFEIFIPGHNYEVDYLLNKVYNNNNPSYIRLSEESHDFELPIEYGKGNVIKEGKLATVICFGPMLKDVWNATKNLDINLLYYSTILPFDELLLQKYFNTNIIICEPFYEGSINYLINKALINKKYYITNIGIPRMFIHNYGSKNEISKNIKLDSINIEERIKLCIL